MSKYLEANKIVKEKYQINSVMGENPVGITYGGADTLTGQKIVVKEFFPETLCERAGDSTLVAGKEGFQERKEQFIKESQILKENSGLEGIAAVLDVFEENDTAYEVMEYVEGVSLEKYLSGSGKQFLVKRIKELMVPVMDSLAILHGKGLVHQNISPDNLIFTNKGKLKLIGFGGITGCISDAGAMYAPIELYQKQPITPSTDVYSLCAAIYRCITGAAPQEACERLKQDMMQPPSKLGIAIETNEEAALMMGLNVYPQKRFQAMVAFRRAFCRDMEAAVLFQPASSEAGQTTVVQPQPRDGTAGGIVPPETGKKNKKKDKKKEKDKQRNKEKSGNGGTIALIVIGAILIAALGTSAFIMGRNLLSGETIKADKDIEDTTGESSEDVAEGTTEENESDAVYETMLNDGDYAGVIDAITSLDIAAASAEEKDKLCKILDQAIAGQYSEFESNVNAGKNTGDYEGVFVAIEEELALYDKLSTNAWAMQYVDRQKVVDKKAAMKTAHIDYLTGDKLRTAISQGDETALNDIISKLQEYTNDGTITQEDFEGRKVSAYTSFVIEKITAMNNNGTGADEILRYIDNNLANTGNNCQVLEFWDYFNAVLGRNIMDAHVRHVSANGYLLEYSNAVNLTNSDVSHLSQYELKLAIYEIFARHGRTFSDQAVNDYFSSYDWYRPSSTSFDESMLNTYEKYNLNLLIEYEISMGYRSGPDTP